MQNFHSFSYIQYIIYSAVYILIYVLMYCISLVRIRLDSDLIPTWLRMDLVLNWIIQNFCNWENILDVNCQNQLFEPIFFSCYCGKFHFINLCYESCIVHTVLTHSPPMRKTFISVQHQTNNFTSLLSSGQAQPNAG